MRKGQTTRDLRIQYVLIITSVITTLSVDLSQSCRPMLGKYGLER